MMIPEAPIWSEQMRPEQTSESCYDLPPTNAQVGRVSSTLLVTTGPPGLRHIVAGILCVLDRTNEGLIPLASVGASKRLPSDMYLIFFTLYGQ